MKLLSMAVGCLPGMALTPAHAQTPRFKPLTEDTMSEAQLKAAHVAQ